MAAVAATPSTAVASFVQKSSTLKQSVPARVQGLSVLRSSRVVCSAEQKERRVASIAAATIASTSSAAFPALAVVENIMGGEGTGLPLGLSDSQLTWIIGGVFTTIWALYFIYSSSLPEGDDNTGLGL